MSMRFSTATQPPTKSLLKLTSHPKLIIKDARHDTCLSDFYSFHIYTLIHAVFVCSFKKIFLT